MEDDALGLMASDRCSLIAPAGYGKTQVIAKGVSLSSDSCSLVLTHTHAGVDALRRRLIALGAPPLAFNIMTIAGFALRWAAAMPGRSGLQSRMPRTAGQWADLYPAAARVLGSKAAKRVLDRSYGRVFVDEYQDCTVEQHDLTLALAEVLPCRLLGDPMQSIFDFGNNKPIDWVEHVLPTFAPVPELTTPHRWISSAPELGEWLRHVREQLTSGAPVDMTGAPPQFVEWVRIDDDDAVLQQVESLRRLVRDGAPAVVGILDLPQRCHHLARRLGGQFSVVEPIDCDDLLAAAEDLDSGDGNHVAGALLDFAGACMTRVKSELGTIRKAIESGRLHVIKTQKHPEQLEALRRLSSDPSPRAMLAGLAAIERTANARTFRRELLGAMKATLREHDGADGSTSLSDMAWRIRDRVRHGGRRAPRLAVARTLLVKGLEFDTVVVLDAEKLRRRDLYVALTRARRRLLVLSKSPQLQPGD